MKVSIKKTYGVLSGLIHSIDLTQASASASLAMRLRPFRPIVNGQIFQSVQSVQFAE